MAALPALLTCPPPRAGDAVVHLDYGLCRLVGARRLELSDGVVHTLELGFRDDDTLHVPVADAVRVWSYGAELPDSRLDSLGTEDWAVGQIGRVRELGASLRAILDLRAEREAGACAVVRLTDAALEAAGAGFPHELTDDQACAVADLAGDLRGGTCANRLLMGDVGSGKTEVAVRVMLAAAMGGHRVRLAAPTRVLARQHLADIAERAEGLGLRVALHSGDLSDGEREAIAADPPDILVGTHGVLGEGFAGVDWALTVIDEEQKFGSKLKDAHVPGHRLRLSATPIPKTLAEARIGLADVSVIARYPAGRGRTETLAISDTDADIVREIEREVARDGQVVALCARIADLKTVRARLKRLLPDLRFATVHGRRKAGRNRRAISRFREGGVDVLMATSMLETGINVARANAMLVFEPERFGLAQLHQLRGRIGRGTRDARFLLVDTADGEATEGWAARRAVLEDLDRRGDGLRLALADSLQRGSGRVDDDEQSGHASEIGLELFEHLVGEMAEDPEASVRDLLASVPQVTGDRDWGLADGEGGLRAAFAQTRAGLDDPDAMLADGEAGDLSVAVAACAARGAVRLGVGEGVWVATLASGEKCEIQGGVGALRDWALEEDVRAAA